MSPDELFLGNNVVAVAEGDVRLTADKAASTVGAGEGRWAGHAAVTKRQRQTGGVASRGCICSAGKGQRSLG